MSHLPERGARAPGARTGSEGAWRIEGEAPIKVVDIELGAPLVAIEGLEGYGGVRALVRLHGAPVGYVDAPVTDGVCTGRRMGEAIFSRHGLVMLRHLMHGGLAAPRSPRTWALERLLNEVPLAYAGVLPKVTVAVCTRDRPAEIAGCLASLAQLDYPSVDILVIDNAPSCDATERLIRSDHPAVRHVREPRPGLNWARNRAILEARGDIIAYTDDDVRVDRGWLRALATVFAEHPEVAAVTGLVAPHELETEAQRRFEAYREGQQSFEREWFSADLTRRGPLAPRLGNTSRLGMGANMAFRREVFGVIGAFDPALDVGTASHAGGDLDMFFRVLKAGCSLVYEPRAIAWHRHRRDSAGLEAQLFNWSCGMYAYMMRSAYAYRDESAAFFGLAFWLLGSWYVPRLARSLARESDLLPLTLAEVHGSVSGFRAYSRARHEAAIIADRFGALGPFLEGSSFTANYTGDRQRVTRRIDLHYPLQALTDLVDSSSVGVLVERNGSAVGRADIANHRRSISVARLSDAIARSLPLSAYGLDQDRGLMELRRWLLT